MRRPIIAGNWKMNKDQKEAADLVKALIPLVKDSKDADVVVAPTFTSISAVAGVIGGTNIGLSAQDCYWEDTGAFTGEISVPMLKAAGCQYCIIGHSERRQFFGETDEKINKKAQALYKHGLTPIICVGEMLEEREAGKMEQVISTQVRGCLAGLPADKVRASVLAYEPVWAIGTGKTATPEQAQEVHALIRSLLKELYGADLAEAVRIQYGGSVKASNAKELMGQKDVDGALVGGAALKAEEFAGIVNFGK